jgi:hypothetical protein
VPEGRCALRWLPAGQACASDYWTQLVSLQCICQALFCFLCIY